MVRPISRFRGGEDTMSTTAGPHGPPSQTTYQDDHPAVAPDAPADDASVSDAPASDAQASDDEAPDYRSRPKASTATNAGPHGPPSASTATTATTAGPHGPPKDY